MKLDNQGKGLLTLLAEKIHTVTPGNPATYIGYKDCHELLGLQRVREKWGESLKVQGLTNLADWTKEEDKPAITGIIIDKVSNEPGAGYFNLFGKQDNPYQWWEEEIRKSRKEDWSPFIHKKYQFICSDLVVPERKDVTVSRIIRDTTISNEVKKLNDYRCQICGITLEFPNGKKYIEVHHIKPIGKPHNGPDCLENLICVCPNHHALLDYGGISIKQSDLRVALGHKISELYINYHNAEIFTP